MILFCLVITSAVLFISFMITTMMLSRGLRILGRRNLSYAQLQSLKGKNAPLDIHPEVEEALAHQKPVVALETALVSHGLPFPQSLDVPLALEEIVRENGAIPATIGIIQGRVKVGLTRAEVERLADGETRKNARKISRRDIGAAIATGADGGSCLSYPRTPFSVHCSRVL